MTNNGNLGERLDKLAYKDTTRTEEMAAYDQLPFSIRAAIDDLPIKMAATDILQYFLEVGERKTLTGIEFNKQFFLRKLENEKLSLLPKEDHQKANHQRS